MRRGKSDPPEQDGDSFGHAEFLKDALSAGAQWSRFADPKLLGVLALLGIGLTDFLSRANGMWHAHQHPACAVWGWTATVALIAGCLFAACTVVSCWRGLSPKTKPRAAAAPRSLFFFGGIATLTSPEDYERVVRARTADGLVSELAHQTWEVAVIAAEKHRWAKRAYLFVMLFLTTWAIGALAQGFAA